MFAKNDPFQTKNGLRRFKKTKSKFERHKNRNLLAKPGVHDLVVVLDRLKPEYNVGKILRTCEVFGCREIRLIGIPFFDPEPAAGALKHIPTKFFEFGIDALASLRAEGYEIYSLSPNGGTELGATELPRKCAIVLGHEEFGLSPELRAENLPSIRIPQFGKSQSLNVSVAASVVIWEYVRAHSKP